MYIELERPLLDDNSVQQVFEKEAARRRVEVKTLITDLIFEEYQRLYWHERRRLKALLASAPKNPVGRPPLSPEIKECRQLYQQFGKRYLELRLQYRTEEDFKAAHGRFYRLLEQNPQNYSVLSWFKKEQPWAREPHVLESLVLPETTAPPSDTNKEQLETKEVTTR